MKQEEEDEEYKALAENYKVRARVCLVSLSLCL